MTLTKDALINEVAKENGYPRNQSVELVETLLEIIKSKLVSPGVDELRWNLPVRPGDALKVMAQQVLRSGLKIICVKEVDA